MLGSFVCSALIVFVLGELGVAFFAKHFEAIFFRPKATHHFVPVVSKKISNALLPVVDNWDNRLAMVYPHLSFREFFVASVTSMEHALASSFWVDAVTGERPL